MSQVTDRPRRSSVRSADIESEQDTVSAAPLSPRERRRGPKNRRRSPAGWIALVAALAVVGIALGKVTAMLKNITDSGGHGGGVLSLIDTIRDPAGRFPGKDRVNILLIGKDYVRDSKGMPYTKHSRSDSIVMLSVDLKHATISGLSIPRDTHVVAPDGRTGKINGTYARGGEPLLAQTISNLIGVAPDYYVAIKPDALKEMVDSLGGVDVVAIDDMNYDDSWGQLHIHLKKGPQHLDGAEAIGFTRFREVKPGTPHSKEEGDPRRMARQQMVIRAMAAEAKKPSNWLHLDKIINLALKQVDTNLSRDQVFALGALLRNMQPDQIQSASLVGHGTPPHHGAYFFYPDRKKTEAMVDWLLKGDEAAADRLTVVDVENGTTVPGVARRVADALREQGFDAKSTGITPESAKASPGGLPETEVLYGKAVVASRAQRILQVLGRGKLEKQAPISVGAGSSVNAATVDAADPDAPDVTVVVGRDVAANFAQRSAEL